MWVLDYLEDVESDLSVFHRVDDFRALSSVRFYSLSARLPHYDGAVRHVLAAAIEREQERPDLHLVPAGQSTEVSPATLAALSQNDQGFPTIGYRGA